MVHGKLALALICAAVLTPSASASEDVAVFVDGIRVSFDVDPVIINDRTMVPMRAIFEALGAEVTWDEEAQTAVGVRGDVNVSIGVGDPVMYRDGEDITLESPAVIINDRTLVPVRAVSEAFDCAVSWNGDTSTVFIVSDSSEGFFIPELVPEYSGSAYTVINGNVPYFDESEISSVSFESYSELDWLGRCGEAFASLSIDTMPTEERGAIGMIKPSGWVTSKYDFIDGKYLYNRCHLIGYQLSAENANEKNLITGTRYMNTEGMLPFENMTADYIEATGNHVMYRVTPDFRGSELVARGVLMEALSVEDGGSGLCFNVYCYNVQPGVGISYLDGSNHAAVPEDVLTGTETVYILNTRSKKFHYPDCPGVSNMSEKNKREYSGSRAELTAQGYSPCGICAP